MEHQSSLSPIDEDDKDPRGRSATYEDLPMVTPKVRTLTDTTQRQNAENAILRKQLMAIKEKEDRLNDRIQDSKSSRQHSPAQRGVTPQTKQQTPHPRSRHGPPSRPALWA
jgi:hypothetical protein